jgi:hypothetical protein|tara:strand:- start:175 stop:603 length:429 start_codon:yes stop_codon:yes gene_type:complete
MSTIIIDTITGKSTATTVTIGSTPVVSASANSMTIRGEGSNQTSIQQGLAKAWWSSNDVTLKDNFNIGSVTDIAASTYDFNFTTAMVNDDYAHPCSTINTTANDVLLTTGVTTARVRQKGITSNTGNAVDTQPSGAVFGDLA